MKEQKIGIDSNCLSYLIDALINVSEPSDDLKDERVALVRGWFYVTGTYYATTTVMSECTRIQNIDRQTLHVNFIITRIFDESIRNPAVIHARTTELFSTHPKWEDCLILAEGEDIELDTLLTCDNQFKKRLTSKLNNVSLVKPSDFWNSLNIPKGTCPKIEPSQTHPLFLETWWRW